MYFQQLVIFTLVRQIRHTYQHPNEVRIVKARQPLETILFQTSNISLYFYCPDQQPLHISSDGSEDCRPSVPPNTAMPRSNEIYHCGSHCRNRSDGIPLESTLLQVICNSCQIDCKKGAERCVCNITYQGHQSIVSLGECQDSNNLRYERICGRGFQRSDFCSKDGLARLLFNESMASCDHTTNETILQKRVGHLEHKLEQYPVSVQIAWFLIIFYCVVFGGTLVTVCHLACECIKDSSRHETPKRKSKVRIISPSTLDTLNRSMTVKTTPNKIPNPNLGKMLVVPEGRSASMEELSPPSVTMLSSEPRNSVNRTSTNLLTQMQKLRVQRRKETNLNSKQVKTKRTSGTD